MKEHTGRDKHGSAKKKTEEHIEEKMQLTITANNVQTSIILLKSPEPSILLKATEAIFKFALTDPNNRLLLFKHGAQPLLWNLMNHPQHSVIRNTIMAIATIIENNEVKEQSYDVSKVERVLEIIGGDYAELTVEFAIHWLACMMDSHIIMNDAIDNDCINLLINRLKSVDPDIIRNVLEALVKISKDFEGRAKLAKQANIPLLLQTLRSDFPQIQALALHMFANLLKLPDVRRDFCDHDYFTDIFRIVETSSLGDIQPYAYDALSAALEDTYTLKIFGTTGQLKKLLDSVACIYDAHISVPALNALCRAAAIDNNRHILSKEEFEKCLLVNFRENENIEIKKKALQGIGLMANFPPSKNVFRSLSTLDYLMNEVTTNRELMTPIAYALCMLTTESVANCITLTECQHNTGIPIVIQEFIASPMATDQDRSYGCNIICNLANTSVALRNRIIQENPMEVLTRSLQSPNDLTQISACLAITSLISSAFMRDEFAKHNGMSFLLELMKSFNANVRKNACWTFTQLCKDPQMALDAANAGAMDLLKTISSSGVVHSKFIDAAFEQFLNSNLSAKYAFLNKLETTDIISGLFYDMGMLRGHGEFITLDQLLTEPIMESRNVITINELDIEGNGGGIIVESNLVKTTSPDNSKSETSQKAKVKESKSKKLLSFLDRIREYLLVLNFSK
ncbi:hypothetical protein SNEBB_002571 [Seison nebaliae]|nr:hypothetical protein SNEBB_002571 [Seison nebaliae]